MPCKLEKRSTKWSFRYTDPSDGIVKRYTCISKNFKKAKREQIEFLDNLDNKKDISKTISLKNFILKYMDYAQTNKRPNSCRIDMFTFKHLSDCISPGKKMHQITTQDIEEFKNDRRKSGVKPSTINRELNSVKALFAKAVEWEYIDKSPAKSAKELKEITKKVRFLDEKECQLVIANAKSFYKDMIIIALYTGFRISEVLNLRWQDIDFATNTISVNPYKDYQPKDYDSRTIPLNSFLKVYLKKMIKYTDYVICNPKQPLIRPKMQTLAVSFRTFFDMLKLKDVSFHTLRHTFASHLVLKGVQIYTVSKLLGHTKLSTTQIYAHLTKDHLTNSVSMLRF